ncbi:hypothetical protein QTP70_001093 [Hemibagrus guttatus]|uniref:CCHC-type domain-containing protein n=1 Tax=Hemibagrus guttatus TaxID=175788 RepID=A0AAE0Q2F0_9TELE|nr:hypothetical protein QTP70_001093 [Hemibagrus guttatus]
MYTTRCIRKANRIVDNPTHSSFSCLLEREKKTKKQTRLLLDYRPWTVYQLPCLDFPFGLYRLDYCFPVTDFLPVPDFAYCSSPIASSAYRSSHFRTAATEYFATGARSSCSKERSSVPTKIRALEWASAVWGADPQVRLSFSYFTGMIQEVFEYPAGGKDISVQLMELCQGSQATADYAIRFRTMAAQSGWNDAALWAVFCAGLKPALQTELACRVEATTLSQFVATAIWLDNLRRQHRAGTQASAAARPRMRTDYPGLREEVPEPMQLGRSRLAEQGHQPRGQMRLCYNCGASGHLSPRCPERPSSAQELGIPTIPCVPSLRITAIDSQPIGEGYLKCQTELLEFQVGLFHHEQLVFYVTSSPANPMILGFPRGLVRWSPTCLKECLREPVSMPCKTSCVEEATPAAHGHLPHPYADFKEVFSEEGAARLPSHQVWDCAIDLLPNTSLPKGRIYPLSLPESKAMEDYIEAALAAGHIRPSTSPLAAGFFFVCKKDGGLWPCIDYWGLNAITIRYPYTLPLVPAALEQLRGARVFTKLDL